MATDPIDYPQLIVNKALLRNGQALTEVNLALNNNPSSDEKLHLKEVQAELTTAREVLIARRNQLQAGTLILAPPDATVIAVINSLLKQVDEARNAGTTANRRLVLASRVLALGIAVMKLK